MLARALAGAVFAAALVASSLSSSAATSGSVVGANVPSATNVSAAGCLPGVANKTEFGNLLPGVSVTTTVPCQVTFGSSNDQAMLRIAQRDGGGKAMWRTTSGTLDTTGWNAPNGWINPPELERTDNAILQADGKLVVVGRAGAWPNWHPAIMRYDDTGAPDNSFSGDGVHQLTLGTGDEFQGFWGAVQQPDGKIVAVGSRKNGAAYQFLVARYNTNGTLDTAGFGAPNGYVLLSTPAPYTQGGGGSHVALEADGDIVVLGNGGAPGWSELLFTRLSSTGVQDTAGFGAPDGWVEQADDAVSNPAGLAIQPDGKILYATDEDMVGRLTTTGTADVGGSFDASGHVWVTKGTDQPWITDLDLLSDGSFLVSGSAVAGGTSQQAVIWKFGANGALATGTWGAPNGYVAHSVGTFDWNGGHQYFSTVVSDDGNVYSNGRAFTGGDYHPTITARSQANGAIDTSFGDTAGVRILDTELGFGNGGGDLVLMHDGGLATITDTFVLRHGGEKVLDFGGGTWGAGANMFGACLGDAANGATVDGFSWTEDGTGGTCQDGAADPWKGIPTSVNDSNAKIAEAPALSQVARADIYFGLRTATNQAPGRYVAPITFDVVAPAT